MAAKKLGDLLVEGGLVTFEQLDMALAEQKRIKARLGTTLIRLGFLKEKELSEFLEKHYQVPTIDLSNFEIEAKVIDMVSRDICEKHCIIPISRAGNTLVVAFADPGNIVIRDDLAFLSRCKVQVVVAPETSILTAIEKYYGASVEFSSITNEMEEGHDEDFSQSSSAVEVLGDGDKEDGAPIVRFVNMVFAEAIRKGASDIHFEPYEKRFRVRYRIDGTLLEASEPPPGTAAAVSSRIKVMSKLDIAEKRRPQDGRLKVRTQNGKEIDFRVSVLPTLFGEKVVLRILDKSNLKLDMGDLGFEPEDLAIFQDAIHQPQGLVLITGPTGSGKTTTIYSALTELNKPNVNISTAEDPVEFNLEGINQVQMNPDIDLNFSSALRSFLRQDPDVVMVGEIRDYETAEIGFKAASTGHLVVSTLHTNDAPATVARLTDMGIPPYIVSSTISLIVAQRLVRKICSHCRSPVKVPPEDLIKIGVPENEVKDYTVMEGMGCNQCGGTGVKGRIAIYELMRMTEPIKERILEKASTMELRKQALKEGMKTLRRSALIKLKRGETTIHDVVHSSVRDF